MEMKLLEKRSLFFPLGSFFSSQEPKKKQSNVPEEDKSEVYNSSIASNL